MATWRRVVCPAARILMLVLAGTVTGCGTTRWTDTHRTATEQLLISDAVDRAVQQMDFRVLMGKDVYFDAQYLMGVVDKDYVVSTLRQHLLASGCVLKEHRSDAAYVVEARAGAVGTDRHDLLYGVPATNIPSVVPLPWVPSSLPEVPLAKRTDQLGVAKLAAYAYHRETGLPVWQSGVSAKTSQVKDIWIFGAGPFQKGTIYEGTVFAGQRLRNPLVRRTPKVDEQQPGVDLTTEMFFEKASMPLVQQPPTNRVAADPTTPETATRVESTAQRGPPDSGPVQPGVTSQGPLLR